MHHFETIMSQNLSKKCILLIVVLVLKFAIPQCYSQADNSKILNFNGGRLDASINFSSSIFYGIGGRASNLAGSISSFTPQAPTALLNPAALAWLNHSSLSLDFTPRVLADASSLYDINSEIEQSTIDGINAYRTEETEISPTKVGLKLGQAGNAAAGAIAFPVYNFVFHASYYRPINFNLDVLFTGLKTKLMTAIPMSDKEEEVIFNSFIEGPLAGRFGMSVASIGLSHKVADDMAVGFSIENYSAAFRANGVFEVNGTMLFAGQEKSFNDPGDLWSNNLHQRIDSNYKGTGWGAKLGYTFRQSQNLSFDAVFSWAADIVTTGAMNLEMNTVPALNIDMNADDEDEILIQAKLDLSKLTYTQPVYNKNYNELTINQPKQLRLGAAYRLGSLEGHLSYGRYFHEFSFEYGEGRIGLKLKNTLRLGLDLKYVQMGLGFVSAETVLVGSKALEDAHSSLLFPLFTLGTRFRFAEKYTLHFTAVSVPMPFMRMSVGYQF